MHECNVDIETMTRHNVPLLVGDLPCNASAEHAAVNELAPSSRDFDAALKLLNDRVSGCTCEMQAATQVGAGDVK